MNDIIFYDSEIYIEEPELEGPPEPLFRLELKEKCEYWFDYYIVDNNSDVKLALLNAKWDGCMNIFPGDVAVHFCEPRACVEYLQLIRSFRQLAASHFEQWTGKDYWDHDDE